LVGFGGLNCLLEPNHDQDIGQGQEGFGTAMEPIDIGQFRIVLGFGVDPSGNRHDDEDQQEIEPPQGEFGGLAGLGEEPEEAEVGEEGEGEEGFFLHELRIENGAVGWVKQRVTQHRQIFWGSYSGATSSVSGCPFACRQIHQAAAIIVQFPTNVIAACSVTSHSRATALS
jgi:hypothetical protein